MESMPAPIYVDGTDLGILETLPALVERRLGEFVVLTDVILREC